VQTLSKRNLLKRNAGLWREALIGVPAVSREQWQQTPLLLRWLVAVRASVLPLTGFAVTFALVLAQPAEGYQWVLASLVMAALLFAHATNNLLNDFVDHNSGLDRGNYFRTQYGVHVLESGLLTKAAHRGYILVTGIVSFTLGLVVCVLAGGWTYVFAGAGAFLVLFYTYPLKRIALGELAVFLAWGPLMVAGTYLVLTGELNWFVFWAGAVYGLGPTVVIFAKHTDKAADDKSRGVVTVPGLLGHLARRVIVGLATLQMVGALALAVVYQWYGLSIIVLASGAYLQLINVCRAPAPAQRPEDYPQAAWPLWYTTHGFVFARQTGLWLTLGALVQIIIQR
jgi:1,4-dihydroxy-2-naphthoate polyprenyltransferase